MGFFSKFFNKDKEDKASAVARINAMAGEFGAQWSEDNFDTFAKEAYLKNVISYRCIEEIARGVAMTPWGLFKRDAKGEKVKVDNHFLLNLIKHPNPDDSFTTLLHRATAFLVLDGNSFWEKVGPLSGPNAGSPKELYVLRPDRMSLSIGKTSGQIEKYIYTVNGEEKSFRVNQVSHKSNILHVKNFHPLDDFYGSSATRSTAKEIDTSNESTEWNMRMLQNEGRPGMIFSAKGNLTQQQYDRFEKQLTDGHSGAKNAGKTMLLEGGTNVNPYGWSPKEMDNIEGSREIARRICSGYGVPAQLVGVPGDNSYLNQSAARQGFWETTVSWYTRLILDEFNNWLFGSDERLFFDFIPDKVAALTPKRELLYKRAETSNFLTINEKRKMVGMETIPDGDIILVQGAMISLDNVEENFTNKKDKTNNEPDRSSNKND